MIQLKRWLPSGLLILFGFLTSYQQPVLMVSLFYALPLLDQPVFFTSPVFWQVLPLTLLTIFARFVPFFLGVSLSTWSKKKNVSTIALVGGIYELLRGGILEMAWTKAIPRLTVIVQRGGRPYQWVDAEVAAAVLDRLYPMQVRVLAAAMLAVLGALAIWSGKDKKKQYYRWGIIALAILLIFVAT